MYSRNDCVTVWVLSLIPFFAPKFPSTRPAEAVAITHGYRGSNLNYLQAENQLRYFAQETGGFAWFPQFDGEIPELLHEVAGFLRQRYSFSYSPTTGAKDGKFHEITAELVALDGGPLTIVDQKGKKQKYQIYARESYQPIKGGAGD